MNEQYICFIAVIVTAESYHLDYADSDYEYDDYRYAKVLPDNNTKPTTTAKSTYEVTEDVIDVQDNRILGPVVANYTLTRPLNTAAPTTREIISNKDFTAVPYNNDVTQPNEHVTTNTNYNKVAPPNKDVTTIDNSNKVKKNYINLLHIDAEFDKPDGTPTGNVNSDNDSKVNGFLNGIKQALVSGFDRVINKHKIISLHDIVAGPLKFLKNLQRKGTDVADHFHKIILREHLDEA